MLKEFNKLCIPIKSSTSDDIYNVHITYNSQLNNINYECTCGMKFGIGMRNKCKHISSVGLSFIKKLNKAKEPDEIKAENFNTYHIPIKSFTSDDQYCVTIKKNILEDEIYYECNCGVKYGIVKRNKCKHIAYIIVNLNQSINININKKFDTIAKDLSSEFENICI